MLLRNLSYILLLFFVTSCDMKMPFAKNSKEINSELASEDYRYSVVIEGQAPHWLLWENIQKQIMPETIIEITQYAGKRQTEEQKNLADSFYAKTLANVKLMKWYDVQKSEKDGYVLGSNPSHSLNPNYVLDGYYLNPEKPEYLMFYHTPKGMVLAGVMFILDEPDVHGEQVGGPETVWHFHDFPGGVCYPLHRKIPNNELIKKGYSPCDGGVFFYRSPEMLHVWFVDHPQGRFATSMTIDKGLLSTSVFSEFTNTTNDFSAVEDFDEDVNHHHH